MSGQCLKITAGLLELTQYSLTQSLDFAVYLIMKLRLNCYRH